MIELSPDQIALIWLLTGAFCFALEAMAIPGIGFLFAGFAAITVGGLINFDYLDPYSPFPQFAFFFALIFVWAAVLWAPLASYKRRNKSDEYMNVIGDSVVVRSKVLEKGKTGKVFWSGTIMKAKLDEKDVKKALKQDDEVYVKEIKGNMFIVSSQPINEMES